MNLKSPKSMNLIMENWRKYQDQTLVENFRAWDAPDILTEEAYLLEEGKILDFIKSGFKQLTTIPKKFKAMVDKGEALGPKKEYEALLALAKNPEFQEKIKKLVIAAEAMVEDPEAIAEWKTISENLSPDDQKSTKLLQKLAERADLDAEIKELQAAAFNASANAQVETAEEVTGETAPPQTKEFLKYILKASAGRFMFGFIDNFIMVCVGGLIDTYLAQQLGIQALAAAGIGNGISDAVADKGESTLINMLGAIGLDPDEIAAEKMKNAPWWMKFLNNNYSPIAIFIGCMVGMFPLLPGIGIGGGAALVGLAGASFAAKVAKSKKHAKAKAAGLSPEEIKAVSE